MGGKQGKGGGSWPSTHSSSSRRSQRSPSESMGENNAGALSISAYQKSLLRDAWKRMSKTGNSNIGSQIFRRMFEKSGEIKRVFQHVAVIEGVFSFGLTPVQAYHQHSGLFIEILDDAINNIDDLSSLIPKCSDYGAKHAPYRSYGFKAEFWDIFGEAMISAAREWEGWKKHRETLRAWTIVISFIVDRMRNGYETAVRRQGLMIQSHESTQGDGDEAQDSAATDKGENEDDDGGDEQEQEQKQASVSRRDYSTSPIASEVNDERL